MQVILLRFDPRTGPRSTAKSSWLERLVAKPSCSSYTKHNLVNLQHLNCLSQLMAHLSCDFPVCDDSMRTMNKDLLQHMCLTVFYISKPYVLYIPPSCFTIIHHFFLCFLLIYNVHTACRTFSRWLHTLGGHIIAEYIYKMLFYSWKYSKIVKANPVCKSRGQIFKVRENIPAKTRTIFHDVILLLPLIS